VNHFKNVKDLPAIYITTGASERAIPSSEVRYMACARSDEDIRRATILDTWLSFESNIKWKARVTG
jgi:hypothetical protein